jgi:hypothetical protein
MKRFGYLILLGILASSAALFAKDKQAPIAVQLDVVSTTPALTVHLHFTNTASHDVYLPKSRACANGDAKNVFTIMAEGQKIRYTGALEQVKPQFPADYIHLEPKGAYDVTTVITQYAFLSGEHTYTLQYSTDMWDKTDKHRYELTSNTVTTPLKAQ